MEDLDQLMEHCSPYNVYEDILWLLMSCVWEKSKVPEMREREKIIRNQKVLNNKIMRGEKINKKSIQTKVSIRNKNKKSLRTLKLKSLRTLK